MEDIINIWNLFINFITNILNLKIINISILQYILFTIIITIIIEIISKILSKGE